MATKKKGKGQVVVLRRKVALIKEEVEERLLQEGEVGEALRKGMVGGEVPTSPPIEARTPPICATSVTKKATSLLNAQTRDQIKPKLRNRL